MKKTPITLLIAEDHCMVREGLRILLELSGEFQVVGEAATGHDAVILSQKVQADIIIMDIAMPVLNGCEATRQIRLLSPDSKILILSAHGDDEYVEHLLSAGVSGFIVKQNSGQILLHAIREIIQGRIFFSPSIALRMQNQEQQAFSRGDKGGARRGLTPREAEVLQMVAEGSPNKEMAAVLGISIKTVEKHRQQLMDKLNLHDTAGLTRYAIASGIIECSIQDTTLG